MSEQRELFLLCPICNTTSSNNGPFSSTRAISLHIVGKAKTRNDEHYGWLMTILPKADLTESINKIANQVYFYVVEEMKKHQAPAWQALDSVTTLTDEELEDLPNQEPLALFEEALTSQERSPSEFERYLTAYKYIWTIEVNLHRLATDFLSGKYGETWWRAFPLSLKQECMTKAHADNERATYDCYISLLDFSEVAKTNKEIFQPIFDGLRLNYKDPPL